MKYNIGHSQNNLSHQRNNIAVEWLTASHQEIEIAGDKWKVLKELKTLEYPPKISVVFLMYFLFLMFLFNYIILSISFLPLNAHTYPSMLSFKFLNSSV